MGPQEEGAVPYPRQGWVSTAKAHLSGGQCLHNHHSVLVPSSQQRPARLQVHGPQASCPVLIATNPVTSLDSTQSVPGPHLSDPVLLPSRLKMCTIYTPGTDTDTDTDAWHSTDRQTWGQAGVSGVSFWHRARLRLARGRAFSVPCPVLVLGIGQCSMSADDALTSSQARLTV